MEGFLLVDKPKDWTSFDVVKRIRGIVSRSTGIAERRIRVGHSGTLDPFATGLLIIMVGKKFTSQADKLLKQDKTYDVVMQLDSESTTGDSEGEISNNEAQSVPSRQSILLTLKNLQGDIMQTPPIYSAIKINGVRAYKLARDNKPVMIAARKITINYNQLIDYSYPIVKFKTDVSSGTYIRSLVVDIGKSLGRTAYTKELRRTRIGLCSIEQAIDLDNLNEHNIEDYLMTSL